MAEDKPKPTPTPDFLNVAHVKPSETGYTKPPGIPKKVENSNDAEG